MIFSNIHFLFYHCKILNKFIDIIFYIIINFLKYK
mgnify:CR=1 FL=1